MMYKGEHHVSKGVTRHVSLASSLCDVCVSVSFPVSGYSGKPDEVVDSSSVDMVCVVSCAHRQDTGIKCRRVTLKSTTSYESTEKPWIHSNQQCNTRQHRIKGGASCHSCRDSM